MHTCNATTVDQLLSVRDAAPVEAYVVQHINTCAACSSELERLRSVRSALQSLPMLSAPPYAPPVFAAASPIARRLRLVGMTAAAAGIATIALLTAFAIHPEREQVDLATQTLAEVATPAPAESAMKPAIASLVIRSQDLESRLQRLPSRPSVERASTTTTIDSLQSTIQWVDYQLSLADDAGLSERQAAQLWQDRIQLMDSLVKVRYAEAQRFAALQ